MANRYWVGGAGTWNTASTTNWSASSGGASGASAPTTSDSVFFDQAGTYTVTVATTASCLDWTVSAGTVNFIGSGFITIAGSVSFISGTTTGGISGGFTFSSTTTGRTITTNEAIFAGSVSFSGVGGGWTLGSSFTSTSIGFGINLSNGTLDSGNFAISTPAFTSTGAGTRQLNLGSSTFTLTSPSTFSVATTGLTFNAGTSTIVVSGPSTSFAGLGLTFYNLSFTNTTARTLAITGANTFNNLAVTAPSTAGVTQVTFAANQTINGTLSTTSTAGNQRVWFRSTTYGLAYNLTINSAPNLTDADFRDLYVVGSAAPISGTRIGNLRGCSGITFDAAKTVYWNLTGAQNWSATGWAATSGGTPSTINFPLAQDTAVFDDTGSVTGTITMDAAIPYMGTVDMSARTSAASILATSSLLTVYGDWKNGSGITLLGSGMLTFSGRNTQSITCAGKTFTQTIVIDTYGGTVQLTDAFNSSLVITVTNGTFNTNGFAVSALTLNSNNANVRTINLGASTVILTGVVSVVLTTTTNLTFNAGTSTINLSSTSAVTFNSGGLSFNNVSFNGSTAISPHTITGANTFANLIFTAPTADGINGCTFAADQIITGTLTCAGATAVRRIFLQSNTIGTQRTLTCAAISAQDCDFRDIVVAGAAANSSPTRAGNCGGNSGITFPAAKTVYWNLAGAQNWSAIGWATSSGGTPALANFPLAQDTAVFDNTGSITTITADSYWNTGTVNMSGRTSAMTFQTGSYSGKFACYGSWSFGTGVTVAYGGAAADMGFYGRGTSTITSNGVGFLCRVTFDCGTGTVQLADALTINPTGILNTVTLSSGTFDAVSYNVTFAEFSAASGAGASTTLKMGSGLWTITGGNGDYIFSLFALTLYKGTANILLSETTANGGNRTFDGAGYCFNKLTIGGSTANTTCTIVGSNLFSELASTKTVTHTINLGTTSQTIGAWTVTGTVGNIVNVTGTATLTIAGARVSGVDYLALGTTTLSSTSPGEFYAGANSTGTGTGVIFTAAPTAVTRYWVGGTGTWDASTTTNWSTASGGAGGASVPTSADAVIFNSASSATAYTVTLTATQLRCGSLTVTGPASGNISLAGTAPLAVHGDLTFPATGMSLYTWNGKITLSGSSTGKTYTPNGMYCPTGNTIEVNGVGCGWTLGSAEVGFFWNIIAGAFSTGNFAFAASLLVFVGTNTRVVNFGSSTVTANSGCNFSSTRNLTFNAGTSTFNINAVNNTYQLGGLSYNNVAISTNYVGSIGITGANTFANFSIIGKATLGSSPCSFSDNQIITGTLTISAGSGATYRNFLQSDTLGTTRTLTVGAFAAGATDVDFRDIVIAGAAAPISGTRFGDCKGNSGITFAAGTNKYWNLAAGGNWSDTGWATTSGGSPAVNNFPLAQDTAWIESTGLNSGATITVNDSWNIGTIDMSARTANTMTLALGSTTPTIYGNWVNGTGSTMSGTTTVKFASRASQTITSAGITFTSVVSITSPGGSVSLLDAFTSTSASGISLNSGTVNANTYNVTMLSFSSTGSNVRTIAIGSGTWTISGSISPWSVGATNLTVTGNGTIKMTNASSKIFSGGSIAYTNITLDQGGAGPLTISGNNTFKDITKSYAGAATIVLPSLTTQTVSQFSAKGTLGNMLTLSGSSATLILTSGFVNSDYLTINSVRAYSLSSTWYAGANSTNGGTLGWIFTAYSWTIMVGVGITIGNGIKLNTD